LICSSYLPETSTTSTTSNELVSPKGLQNELSLAPTKPRKEAQNDPLFAKDGSLKFMKFLKFLQDINYIQPFYKVWFGYHSGREVFHAGIRDRLFLDKSTQLYNYVQECELLGLPAYMSVHPFRARDRVFGLEKLFFDFDSKKDLGKSWNETRDFATKIEKFYNAKTLLVFSGFKGFHVYVWLWSLVEVEKGRELQAKQIYKKLQEKLLKGLKYETLDPQVIGDIKRLARVPYSRHEKTGAFCLPLTLQMQSLQILPSALEGYRNHGLGLGVFQNVTKELQKPKLKRSIHVKKAILRLSSGSVRPCIEVALQTNLHEKSGHLMRLAIATEYLNRGYTIENVVQLFQDQTDFNESKTRYFVEDAQRKGYNPFKCETIQTLGFCLGDRCPILKKRKR
jgi:hypothetical protein